MTPNTNTNLRPTLEIFCQSTLSILSFLLLIILLA